MTLFQTTLQNYSNKNSVCVWGGEGLALNKDTAASMANSVEVPQKIKISSTMIFSISTSEYSSEENEVTISKRYLYPSFIAVHLQQLRHGNNPSVL